MGSRADQAVAETVVGSRIAILMSHRFSTMRIADQIAVIDDGRIAELSSHGASMKLDHVYGRLLALQARG